MNNFHFDFLMYWELQFLHYAFIRGSITSIRSFIRN